jgi:hypothetical protein
MSQWLTEISDRESNESARLQRVAHLNMRIFDLLFRHFKAVVSTYNARHPTQLGFPNALTIKHDSPESDSLGLKIQKNNEPRSALQLRFPINSGAIKISGKQNKTILLDVQDDQPLFFMDGVSHPPETVVELLLKPMLTPADPWVAFRKDALESSGACDRYLETSGQTHRRD